MNDLLHTYEAYASLLTVTNQYWENAENVLGGNSTTYAQGIGGWTLTRSIEVSGFDLSAIPDDATILKYQLVVRARVNSTGNGTFTGTWSRGTAYPINLGTATAATDFTSVKWSINGSAAIYKSELRDAKLQLSNYKSSLTGAYTTYAYTVLMVVECDLPEPQAEVKKLYIGSGQVQKLQLGAAPVQRAYLGGNLVYARAAAQAGTMQGGFVFPFEWQVEAEAQAQEVPLEMMLVLGAVDVPYILDNGITELPPEYAHLLAEAYP